MLINIRPAQHADIPLLSWVMYTAAQSHLTSCPWCTIFAETEVRTRTLLEHILQNPTLPWSYVANFWIAEVNGIPAAAMCGFSVISESSPAPADTELDIAEQTFNYSQQRLAEIQQRLTVASFGFPEDIPNAWAIENVASLPEYRGKGVIDRLFDHILKEGQKKGFKHAQILSLIGNEQGQRSFERNGFNVINQKTHPDFEAMFGTPGAKILMQNI